MENLSIEQIIKLEESDRVEKTRSDSDTDKLCQAVTAFSNDFPNHQKCGYFIVGLDDKTNARMGFVADDKAQLSIISRIRDNGKILPIPTFDVIKDSDPTGDLLIIKVYPSLEPPVRYDNDIWIRIGPRKVKADKVHERILAERNFLSNAPFERWPCNGAAIADISIPFFLNTYLPMSVSAEVLAENDRDIYHKLAALGLWNIHKNVPTNLAVIALAPEPVQFLAGCYVQYVRWLGDDMASEPLQELSISGMVYDVIKTLEPLLQSVVATEISKGTGFQEQFVASYPYDALRELVLNAIMHRDYASHAPIRINVFSARLQIDNPGAAYGRAAQDITMNEYRNPGLAAVLKQLGFVNQFGRGIPRVRALCAKNGNALQIDPLAGGGTSFMIILHKTSIG